jgi:phosphate butyryltransferase
MHITMQAKVSIAVSAIRTFEELRQCARMLGPKRVGVVVADDEVALLAASATLDLGLAIPVLIGNEPKVRDRIRAIGLRDLAAKAEFMEAPDWRTAAALATQLARDAKLDILLKGHLRTDELLRAVLDKQAGLRTGRLLSDVMLYEDTLAGYRRLVGVTDGGLNVAPDLEQKKQILLNALDVMHAIGIERPKMAIMSATEAVTESLPSTVDAAALTEMAKLGGFGDCELYGPLALDNALLESAAKEKGITSPVAGHADCMVVPNIESGNLLGKAVKYLGGSQCGHVVLGAKVPVLIPSRVESVDDKINSVALGVLVHGR